MRNSGGGGGVVVVLCEKHSFLVPVLGGGKRCAGWRARVLSG